MNNRFSLPQGRTFRLWTLQQNIFGLNLEEGLGEASELEIVEQWNQLPGKMWNSLHWRFFKRRVVRYLSGMGQE